MSPDVRWVLLYTKQHAESWAEINLRNQGFLTLLPRVRMRTGVAPLFPRYLFAAYADAQRPSTMQNTFGVMYVVQCGEFPARVHCDVIAEIRDRMDHHGVVRLDATESASVALFAKRQRDRLQALEKFAAAGFRVRAA